MARYSISCRGRATPTNSTRGSINSQQSRERWTVCDVNVPKEEIVYCCQVFVAFVVIVVGLANLSFTESDTCLWTSLISGALGYLLPNPSLHRNESVLPNAAIEQFDGLPPGEYSGSIHDETEQSD